MYIYDSCRSAINACMETRTFAVAHMYKDEKTMDSHTHDCYEIYFSISGGKQFLIDDRLYEFHKGDIFFINQYESHYLVKIDKQVHERIVFSIHPEYLKLLSTKETDLSRCFTYRDEAFGHKVTLCDDEQKRFLYYINRLSDRYDFGQELMDRAVFIEIITFLNGIFALRCQQKSDPSKKKNTASTGTHAKLMNELCSYVSQHLTEDLSISALAAQFYMSGPYLCKIFKEETGTTINRYVTMKRIVYAKKLLMEGFSVTDTCELCGFKDYSNFLRSFTKTVGVSPKKYTSYIH